MIERLSLNQEIDLLKYQKLLDHIYDKNPYITPEYIKYFSGGLNEAICLVERLSEEKITLLPVFLRRICINNDSTEYFDIITPYGYSGPLYSNNIKKEDLFSFWAKIVEWYKANNVVSEFIRFSLNDNHVGYPGEITDTMKNVKGVILNQENQWKNFEHKVRKNVKRALNEGLKVTIKKGKDVTHDEISEFSDIYIHTMERTKANEGFFYNDSVFRNFVLKKPSDCAFSFVYDDGKCISTEFVLLNNEVMFSFLGGTLSHSFNKRPNDLLKFELINWCRNTGLKFYILGGGYGLDDGIFNYKKSFFPNDVITFKTGRRIIHRKIYDELIAIANKKRIGQGKDTLDNHRDSFFPLYRFSDH